MLPSEFDEPEPFAFQFHATKFSELPLTPPSQPTVKPSVPQAVKVFESVLSAT